MEKRHSRKAGLILLALAVLALLAFLLTQMAGRSGAPGRALLADRPAAVELGQSWQDWFLTDRTQQECEAYLAGTLQEVQKLGGQLLLLTGRAGEGALFRSRDAALPMLASIPAGDGLLHRFDPVTALQKQAEALGLQVALLATDPAGKLLPPEALEQLAPALEQYAQKRGLPIFAVQPPAGDGTDPMTRYISQEVTLLRADGSPAALAAAALQTPGTGAVLGNYEALLANPQDALLYRTFTEEQPAGEALLPQTVPQTLAFAYPAAGAVVYTDQVFLMGTSDPAQPLTLNGKAVERHGSRGVWGVLADVTEGENVFTASQGTQTAQLNFTRTVSDWKPGQPVSDGSGPAKWGQMLRITAPLASVLTDPGDPDSIQMTAYQGAVAQVAQSLPLTRGNKNTFAYQLQSGGFVLAKDCELVDADSAAFTGVSVETLENGDQLLTFQGQGTPLYYHEWEDHTLTLRFYSASFTGQWPDSTDFVTGFTPGQVHTGFSVSMHFAPEAPLWGYHVDYVDGTTQIYLKRAPALSNAATGPLTGTVVLLDAGHGDQDNGAMGCAGPDAPQEKDVNLALATAAKHRLEQLGATVLMSRTDDTFFTLGQRVQQLNREKPDFFISVHHNSAALDQDLNRNGGVEAYWFYTEGKPLADNLVKALGETTGRVQRGSFYNYFYVTRSNICPAVLLEVGFMTVPREYESVADESTIWAEADALAQAVMQSIPQ